MVEASKSKRNAQYSIRYTNTERKETQSNKQKGVYYRSYHKNTYTDLKLSMLNKSFPDHM